MLKFLSWTRWPSSQERRSFLARFATIVLGGIAALFPFAAGWSVLFDPLRRRRDANGEANAAGFVRVCPLDALPADGVPRAFVLSTDVTDAWTRVPNQRVGMVFLRHVAEGSNPRILALSAECPHLGCAVTFAAAENRFECPCHASAFGVDGREIIGPSLRGLDPLPAKVVTQNGQQEVWVAYQRYRTGVAERIPVG
ncbi:MAG: Rieske 2Fe-2S domain-containing protein [Planctomycetes bacterium]|nr:Rieske 2Fe-2S domain-containing protein [Planctomycetota bacterium]